MQSATHSECASGTHARYKCTPWRWHAEEADRKKTPTVDAREVKMLQSAESNLDEQASSSVHITLSSLLFCTKSMRLTSWKKQWPTDFAPVVCDCRKKGIAIYSYIKFEYWVDLRSPSVFLLWWHLQCVAAPQARAGIHRSWRQISFNKPNPHSKGETSPQRCQQLQPSSLKPAQHGYKIYNLNGAVIETVLARYCIFNLRPSTTYVY